MIEVVLDTETTGLSVLDGHRIVEIGCIELKDLIPTKNKFHAFINPERKVSDDAFKVHGYTNEFLSKQKKFHEVVDEFLKFIEGKRLVIHNAEFDISHLNNEMNILGKPKIKEDVVDTLKIARDKFPGSGISLDALCKRYNIDNSRREKHNAIIDCELLSKIYINLLDQKEPSLNFSTHNIVEENLKNISKQDYSKKVVPISKEEFELHKSFIKSKMKKNYF